MMRQKSLLILVSVYLLLMVIGLETGSMLLKSIYVDETMQPVVEHPESVSSSLQLLAYMLFVTAIFLFLIKKGKKHFIKYFMYMALLMGMLISTSAFIGYFSVFVAPILLIVFIFKKENIIVLDFTMIVAISGLGALLGSSLHFKPSLVLLLGLSIYDFIAVFGTKHMVILAKSSGKDLPMMVAIPTGERVMGLGTGDLAIPLMFTVSVLHSFGLGIAIPTMLGGLMGLMSLFYYILEKKDVVLPALPPIALGLLFGFTLSSLILN